MALLKGAANAISAQQRAVTLDLYAKVTAAGRNHK